MRLGLTTQGSPVLVGLAPGSDEGHDPWASFLGELTDRGLRAPLLVITDGAAGLIGAVEVVFSNSLRQRCLVHRCRNLLAKVPAHAQAEVKAAFWQIFDDLDAEPGEAAVAQARQRATPSPTATTAATPPRWSACWPPCPSSPPSCGFLVSTGPGSATPT